MAPEARGGDLADCPGRLIDEHALTSYFDIEAGGRADVEGEHLIVGVLAEGRTQVKSCGLNTIECIADVVERFELQHDVDQTSRMREGGESQTMVTRVAAQKGEAHGALERVTHAKPEHLREEFATRFEIGCGKHDVPQAKLSGFEAPTTDR
jgi:hypothetical protein